MSYQEYIIRLELRPDEEGFSDVMVHLTDKGQLARAYTFADELGVVPKSWVLGPSSNPIFVNLSRQFINKFQSEIRNQIEEENEVES